MNKTDDFRRLK